MVSHKSLKLSLLFFNTYFFLVLLWLDEFHYPILKFAGTFFSPVVVCYWNPSIGFLYAVNVFFRSIIFVWYFLGFSIYLWKFSLCSCLNSDLVSIFIMVILKCLADKSVISVSPDWFLEIFLFLLFRTYSPVFSYFLSLRVSFFALDKTTNSCSLDLVVFVQELNLLNQPDPSSWLSFKLLWFSKPSSLFVMSLSSWGCVKTNQCPKGEDYS